MANYLDENGLRTLVSKIKDNFVPYTGATKDINIGNHSFTMSSVFTVGSESSVCTQTTPGSIVLKNPIGTLSIGTYSLTVNGTTIYWPTLSADPNGKYLALRSDIPSIDDYLSPTSTNAVQNKVVNSTISELSYQLAMVRENLFQTVLSEIDYSEDFATLYPIPDTLSDTDGTHRVLFSETQLREVAGNSIAYNQLIIIPTLPTTTENGITFTNNGDGSVTIQGTATAQTTFILCGNLNRNVPLGHKVMITNFATPNGYFLYDGYESNLGNLVNSPNAYIKAKEASSTIISPRINIDNGTVIDKAQTVKVMYFDLTLMGLDSVSTVEEARSELLKRGIDIDQYNPFSEGEIRNTTASGAKVNGYNLLNLGRTEGDTTGWERENTAKRSFDETKYYVGISANNYYSTTAVKDYSVTGNSVMVNGRGGYGIGFPIRVLPGKTYQVEFTATDGTKQYRVCWYDREGSLISFNLDENKNKVAPDNAYWGLLVLSPSTPNTNVTFSDICFHLSTLRTGYAPYKESKAISFASTELLGAGEAHDTIEVVEGDKVAGIQRYNLVKVKRVGTVDLGTLPINSFIKGSESRWLISASAIAGIYTNTDNSKPANILCQKWITVNADSVSSSTGFSTIYIANGGANIFIKDSTYDNMTIDQFKAAMNGVILNYELATPTRTVIAENLTFEEVSATIEQGGSIETIYETLAPNCTTGFVVKKATEVSK